MCIWFLIPAVAVIAVLVGLILYMIFNATKSGV